MSTDGVVVYSSGVSGSVFIAKQTSFVKDVLTARKIPFTYVDISIDEAGKNHMQNNSKATNPKSMPQVFKNGVYIGDYEALHLANEDGELAQLFQ